MTQNKGRCKNGARVFAGSSGESLLVAKVVSRYLLHISMESTLSSMKHWIAECSKSLKQLLFNKYKKIYIKKVWARITFHECLYCFVHTIIKVLQNQDDFIVALIRNYCTYCIYLEKMTGSFNSNTSRSLGSRSVLQKVTERMTFWTILSFFSVSNSTYNHLTGNNK
jgi:hypothetical protein